jgi:hypothetical protein
MKHQFFRLSTVQHKSSIIRNHSDTSTDQVSAFTTRPVDPEVDRNLVATSNTSPAVLEVFGSLIIRFKEGLVSFSIVLLHCPLFPESLRDEPITSLHFWCCY